MVNQTCGSRESMREPRFRRMEVHMDIKKYFATHEGTGVMATSDRSGNVNMAVYARPHVFDDLTVGFIMRNRLTRKNLLENDHAGYLFRERGESHSGVRMKLRLLSESTDHELLATSRKPGYDKGREADGEARFLATFAIEKCYALIGGREIDFK